MADSPSVYPYPGPDTTNSPGLLVPITLTLAIAWGLYMARMYTRLRPVNNLGWDDYTVSGAILLATIGLVLQGISTAYGIGRHSYYVSYESGKIANHYGFVAQPICVWALCLAKCSVACVLLRIKQRRSWLIFLYTAIAIQIVSAVAANVAQFMQCKPLSALWDPQVAQALTTKCWKPKNIQISSYVNAGVGILSDIVLSLLPISFLRRMNRPLRERLLLGFLMALGLLATFASIYKTTILAQYRDIKDPFWDVTRLSLWWQLEQNIGIIAACIPCLRSPFEKVLRHIGIFEKNPHSSPVYISRSERLSTRKSAGRGDEVTNISDEGTIEGISLQNQLSSDTVRPPLGGISKTTELYSSAERIENDHDWNLRRDLGEMWK